MTPGQRKNLKRLLSPESIACVGGDAAAFAIEQCVAASFRGPIWGVNPNRSMLGGVPCYPRVEDLPEAPDAVFLAVPARHAIETVSSLSSAGSGGIVSFTAGFGELGADGEKLEGELIAAAGDVALVGPNCSGLLNFVHDALLWPFSHRSMQVEKGVAFITQSGMLGNTITLNQRSVDFSYIISSGNQAMLGVEDFLEVLVEDPAVSAVGLYLEALNDVQQFAKVAMEYLDRGIPIVVHKAGGSDIGARLTITHTGSLSGSDDLYQALFDRLGVIRVSSPVMMLETLKLLTVAGAPSGNRIAALTCSGGDATMVADTGDELGLTFPQPSPSVAAAMTEQLPEIATVSNPLDYTTPLWGEESKLATLIETMLSDNYDAALMVQDYPGPDIDASETAYQADTRAFASATRAAGIPAAVTSCLPENLDRATRTAMIESGIAPMQGLHDALRAMALCAAYGARRKDFDQRTRPDKLNLLHSMPSSSRQTVLDEWAGKQWINNAGIATPEGAVCGADDAPQTAASIGYPIVLKMVSANLPHKTEAGAVKLNLKNERDLCRAIEQIQTSVRDYAPDAVTDVFLVEQMVETPVAELLLGIRYDPQFGQVLVLASGGTLVELVNDAVSLLLPVDRASLDRALCSLRVSRILAGYRGGPPGDREAVLQAILRLVTAAGSELDRILEIDINPFMVMTDRVVAADVLIKIR